MHLRRSQEKPCFYMVVGSSGHERYTGRKPAKCFKQHILFLCLRLFSIWQYVSEYVLHAHRTVLKSVHMVMLFGSATKIWHLLRRITSMVRHNYVGRRVLWSRPAQNSIDYNNRWNKNTAEEIYLLGYIVYSLFKVNRCFGGTFRLHFHALLATRLMLASWFPQSLIVKVKEPKLKAVRTSVPRRM